MSDALSDRSRARRRRAAFESPSGSAQLAGYLREAAQAVDPQPLPR